ncbi:MAG TPA: alpha/beta hydrolase [Pyrinomonadaceae bacterium]|jgi:pimeloyl-ACP methyl ester carboxylesterase
MNIESFSLKKRCIPLKAGRVAYYEEGTGTPIVFLHGCPFSSYIWRSVIPRLSPTFRCLAPDLLGLGDTETLRSADWSLPAQARMVTEFLDALGLDRVNLVGHDHGGAISQILAAECPERIKKLVLANVEAFDNWPSADEKPFVIATQLPVLGRFVLWLWSFPRLAKLALSAGSAVYDKRVLTPELVGGFVGANLSDSHRRAKTQRFLAGQLDKRNNNCTLGILGGLRRFNKPTMILWGKDDPHFGPKWAERLQREIPGVKRLEIIPATGHLVMEEQPEKFASLVLDFFLEGQDAYLMQKKG